jgi:hypothetical protein
VVDERSELEDLFLSPESLAKYTFQWAASTDDRAKYATLAMEKFHEFMYGKSVPMQLRSDMLAHLNTLVYNHGDNPIRAADALTDLVKTTLDHMDEIVPARCVLSALMKIYRRPQMRPCARDGRGPIYSEWAGRRIRIYFYMEHSHPVIKEIEWQGNLHNKRAGMMARGKR